MRIIGYNAGMGCGKSTAIELLKHTGEEVILVKFAGPLYDMQEYMYDRVNLVYKRPQSFTKDRKLLQWIGTEWGRQTISETVWVDLWKATVEDIINRYPDNTIIVCDDVRFDNEAEIIKSMGGIMIKITSEKAHERIDTASGIANHKSETGISEKYIDAQVPNDGTIEEFRRNLNMAYQVLGIFD